MSNEIQIAINEAQEALYAVRTYIGDLLEIQKMLLESGFRYDTRNDIPTYILDLFPEVRITASILKQDRSQILVSAHGEHVSVDLRANSELDDVTRVKDAVLTTITYCSEVALKANQTAQQRTLSRIDYDVN